MSAAERGAYLPEGARASGATATARHAPAHALDRHVASYFSVSLPPGSRGSVRTLPEGCADVMFDLGSQPRGWLSGPRTRARIFEHTGPVELLGAQLQPGVARLLTSTPARELLDATLPLEQVLAGGDLAVPTLLGALQRATGSPARCAELDRFLLQRFGGACVDPRVSLALESVIERGGAADVSELARAVAASPRNLTRLFHAWVGMSPKLFCRMVRFQNVLRHLAAGGKPDWAALSAELGYADQSHLIRDFGDFAQVSPGALR